MLLGAIQTRGSNSSWEGSVLVGSVPLDVVPLELDEKSVLELSILHQAALFISKANVGQLDREDRAIHDLLGC